MNKMRREFMARIVGAIGTVGIIVATPTRARACLYGTWHVQCANGHIDTVTQGTCQHVCEHSGCGLQVFSGDDVTVVCRNGHPNRIKTVKPATTSFICPICKTDCCLGS